MIAPSHEASADDRGEQRQAEREELHQYYEALLRSVGWPSNESNGAPHTLGLTSCQRGEGVSTVAAHLAVTAAEMGNRRVLLVDANFARPCVPRIFRIAGRPGLIEALRGEADWSELVHRSTVPHLSLLVAGRLGDRNPAAICGDPTLPRLLIDLAGNFDLVVCDLPAVGHSAAALRLSAMCDGMLLVVEAERVHREVARRVTRLLCQAGAKPLGVVLNKYSRHVPNWLHGTF